LSNLFRVQDHADIQVTKTPIYGSCVDLGFLKIHTPPWPTTTNATCWRC